MNDTTLPGGAYTLTDGLVVNRMGYGAMQLAGPHVFGPPKDHATAIAVLHEAVQMGINHIDTSDFYGPHVTNLLIKEALHPYKSDLIIVTKIGAKRDNEGNWLPAQSEEELRQAVFDNLENLGLQQLDVVNFRIMDSETSGESIAKPYRVVAGMRQEGLIKHLGISNASAEQIAEAQSIAPIVCVQNMYNVSHRADDELIDSLASQNIGYAPYFPLGGFTPLQSETLSAVAQRLGAHPMGVALAWLLQRSPNILLIPGTSSLAHLHENIAAASIILPQDAIDELNHIAEATL